MRVEFSTDGSQAFSTTSSCVSEDIGIYTLRPENVPRQWSQAPAWEELSDCDRDHAHTRRVEDWIAVNLREPMSRTDLCRVAGLDARSLSRAFRNKHGMGPMQFVRARRLAAVNRLLLGSEPAATTVTEIALYYGFDHLSRFAADYRRAFGELPSATLKRQTPRRHGAIQG
jgi:AraC-like DNA-binding protein